MIQAFLTYCPTVPSLRPPVSDGYSWCAASRDCSSLAARRSSPSCSRRHAVSVSQLRRSGLRLKFMRTSLFFEEFHALNIAAVAVEIDVSDILCMGQAKDLSKTEA